MWTPQEAVHLIVAFVFVNWQRTKTAQIDVRRAARVSNAFFRRNKMCVLPGRVFGVVWFILYQMLVIVCFLYFEYASTSRLYVATFVLFTLNIVLNKMWSVAFWDGRDAAGALLVMIPLIATSIATIILLGLSYEYELYGLLIGLYAPYVVWLWVAAYLNWRIWAYKQPTALSQYDKASLQQLQ